MKCMRRLKAKKHTSTLYGKTDEAAAVYSFEKNMVCHKSIIGAELTQQYCVVMEGLCQTWAKRGGMVGHLKLFLESEEKETLWLSSVGEEVTINQSHGWQNSAMTGYTLSMTAIVLLVPKKQLIEDVENSLLMHFKK